MEPPNPWPDSGEQHGRMFKENNLFIDLLARVTEEFYCGSNRESWANSLNEWNLKLATLHSLL